MHEAKSNVFAPRDSLGIRVINAISSPEVYWLCDTETVVVPVAVFPDASLHCTEIV